MSTGTNSNNKFLSASKITAYADVEAGIRNDMKKRHDAGTNADPIVAVRCFAWFMVLRRRKPHSAKSDSPKVWSASY